MKYTITMSRARIETCFWRSRWSAGPARLERRSRSLPWQQSWLARDPGTVARAIGARNLVATAVELVHGLGTLSNRMASRSARPVVHPVSSSPHRVSPASSSWSSIRNRRRADRGADARCPHSRLLALPVESEGDPVLLDFTSGLAGARSALRQPPPALRRAGFDVACADVSRSSLDESDSVLGLDRILAADAHRDQARAAAHRLLAPPQSTAHLCAFDIPRRSMPSCSARGASSALNGELRPIRPGPRPGTGEGRALGRMGHRGTAAR